MYNKSEIHEAKIIVQVHEAGARIGVTYSTDKEQEEAKVRNCNRSGQIINQKHRHGQDPLMAVT